MYDGVGVCSHIIWLRGAARVLPTGHRTTNRRRRPDNHLDGSLEVGDSPIRVSETGSQLPSHIDPAVSMDRRPGSKDSGVKLWANKSIATGMHMGVVVQGSRALPGFQIVEIHVCRFRSRFRVKVPLRLQTPRSDGVMQLHTFGSDGCSTSITQCLWCRVLDHRY
ncbi:hypothetical protein B0T14DRAFT_57015 [Immersiella caudata]|uniref:Uncharacterized protein n=1 Tax=Immersiella caudata TaxID=314043 RepID=A0AA39XFU6_9PEZI|nr:hypothetical protein B0T14DRAFT_57015 [Immersiella caudata]